MSVDYSALELSDGAFDKLCAIIHKATGITIGQGRKSLLLSRLRSRLREIQETGFDAYISRVQKSPEELQELVNRVTTNKTYFHRTPRVWSHFCDTAVPEFVDRGAKRAFRVWSGASSTGEEAHTAGVLLEEIRLTTPALDYRITGTDVSSAVVQTAKAGLYKPATLAQFRKALPDIVKRHMTGDDETGWRVNPKIKSKIEFKLHNLQERLKNTSPFDSVFLRNVLIYFTPEDQENILRNVARVLSPDGYLYIGESETITRLDTDFDMVAPMVYRLKSASGQAAA